MEKVEIRVNRLIYPDDLVSEVLQEFRSAIQNPKIEVDGHYLVIKGKTEDDPNLVSREFHNFLVARFRERMRVL